MRVPHSAFRVIPSLLLSLVTAILLPVQSTAQRAKGFPAHNSGNAPGHTTFKPHLSKGGKAHNKNVADGAAKGQANEGTAPNTNGGSGGGTGKSDSINYNASKSNTGNFTVHKTIDSASPSVAGDPHPQPGMAVKGQGVPENPKGTKKSATDDWQAPTSAAPATGTPKGKSATDDWQSPN